MTPREKRKHNDHPFLCHPSISYGFEIGEEVQWFEWLHKYLKSIRNLISDISQKRWEDHTDETIEYFNNLKRERDHIHRTLLYTSLSYKFRNYHKFFMKSTKIDREFLEEWRSRTLKMYEKSPYKDIKYYLSLIKS
jgi:hypothetical protein